MLRGVPLSMTKGWDVAIERSDYFFRGAGSYAGTSFFTGGMLRKYANTDFKSWSVIFPYACHGMGGWIGRDSPKCLPLRRALMNISSVQMPMPLMGSGVRLIA